jgi:predicted ATP-grasp superfamily ATP-dependent carboligase
MSYLEWVRHPELRNPVAVLAFAGWGDAGDASTDAARHLIASFEGDAFARIDPDEFYEFQSRRPEVEMTEAGVRTIHWPRNEFHALHHPDGDLVVVLGEEPHLKWRAFGSAVSEALKTLGVQRALLLGAFLGQVPHTVPVPLVGSSPNPMLLAENGVSSSRYEGPTGIVGSLTHQLAEAGIATMSVWAAVPHYLSNQPYPPAVYTLVRKAMAILGLTLETSELAVAAAEYKFNVDAVISGNEELAEYVKKLEAAIGDEDDEEVRQDPAEDLVEEIERFLRDT